jgi:hypothetical protein
MGWIDVLFTIVKARMIGADHNVFFVFPEPFWVGFGRHW